MKIKQTLIGGIQKFSTEDGPGIRTTVFLKGCPLKCKWCHNPELMEFGYSLLYTENKCIGCGACIQRCPNGALSMDDNRKIQINRSRCTRCGNCVEECYAEALRLVGEKKTDEEILQEALKDRGFYEETGGGVTLSGGEITSNLSRAKGLLHLLRSEGLSVAVDTCGYCDYEELLALAAEANIILYDLKAMDDGTHRDLTGVSNERILSNLERLAKDPALHDKVIIRLPMIQGLNDSDEAVDALVAFLAPLGLKKVDILPYHPLGVGKARNVGMDQTEFQPPSDTKLDDMVARFQKVGITPRIMGRDS